MKATNAFKVCLGVIAGMQLTACGPSFKPEQIQTEAPQSESETGWIVQTTSADQLVDVMNANPSAKIRWLDQNQNLAEITNIEKNQLTLNLDQSQIIQKNRMIQFIQPMNQNTSELISQNPVTGSPTVQVFLQKCLKRSEQPLSVINLRNGQRTRLQRRVIPGPRKENFLFYYEQPIHLPQSKMLWVVRYPKTSQTPGYTSETSSIQFKPTVGGVYSISLLTQTSSGLCSTDTFEFAVNIPRPYRGPQPIRQTASVSVDLFRHLTSVFATSVWPVTKGQGAVVAVVDTGVFSNHPDLSRNIFQNREEIPNNGIDDDKNGVIDDANGYNFAYGNAFPDDDNGHGTHVAGLVTGQYSGVAPLATLLPIKAMNAFGAGDVATSAAAILYAIKMKVKIINCSFGHEELSRKDVVIRNAIQKAESSGILVVAAAGNGDDQGRPRNNDVQPSYPANFRFSNVISVASTNFMNLPATYSNFGSKTVDLSAPGGDQSQFGGGIYSTSDQPGNGQLYKAMSGTSMSAPIVSGIAALVASAAPRLTAAQIRQVLLSSVDLNPKLAGLSVTSGTVNATKSVTTAKKIGQTLQGAPRLKASVSLGMK